MNDEQINLLEWLVTYPPDISEVKPAADAAPAEADVTQVRLTRTNPACNMHRFYSLELATSLFGEYVGGAIGDGSEPWARAEPAGATSPMTCPYPKETFRLCSC